MSSVSYDASGNQLSWGGWSYSYDPTNQLSTVTGTGVNRTYLYTVSGERVSERDNLAGTTTVWIRDLDGRILRELKKTGSSWSWVRDTIWRDGSLLAAVDSSTTKHFHLDHLGSPRLITGSGGVKLADHAYFPFGVEASGTSDGERMRFTGHERDDSTGLDYMHLRYYNPGISRFLSVDAMGGELKCPQSWNGYSYVRNNPMGKVDPNGLYGIDVHRYLTTYLALASGQLSSSEAERIGLGDQGVDDNTPANPFKPNDFRLHFMSNQEAVALFNQAGSLEDAGAALHSMQDSYAHAGFRWPLGHLFAGHKPDQPWRNPLLAMAMARQTFQMLGGDPEQLDSRFLWLLFNLRSKSESIMMLQEATKWFTGGTPSSFTLHVSGRAMALQWADYLLGRGYRVFIDGVEYLGSGRDDDGGR
jgi:RHS repeat-associated protein